MMRRSPCILYNKSVYPLPHSLPHSLLCMCSLPMRIQGQDVIAGDRVPMKLSELQQAQAWGPALYDDLRGVEGVVEKYYRDMQVRLCWYVGWGDGWGISLSALGAQSPSSCALLTLLSLSNP
jgi:hypothetical protein